MADPETLPGLAALERVQEQASRHHALFTKSKASSFILSGETRGDILGWLVMAEFRPFSAVTGDKGAVLVAVDDVGQTWAAIPAEIRAHQEAFGNSR